MVRHYVSRNRPMITALVVVFVLALFIYTEELQVVDERLDIISVSDSVIPDKAVVQEKLPIVIKAKTPIVLPSVSISYTPVLKEGTVYYISPTNFEGWFHVEGVTNDVEITVLREAMIIPGYYRYELVPTGAVLIPL